MPAPNRPKPNIQPILAASRALSDRIHSKNSTASENTVTGKNPKGAKPNTASRPAPKVRMDLFKCRMFTSHTRKIDFADYTGSKLPTTLRKRATERSM